MHKITLRLIVPMCCMLLTVIAACGTATATPSQTTPTPAAKSLLTLKTITPGPDLSPKGTATPASGLVRVDMGDSYFYPSLITVTVGSTVQWKHMGNIAHDILSRERNWGVAFITAGGVFENTFRREGVYDYYCGIHAPGMTGRIVVVR